MDDIAAMMAMQGDPSLGGPPAAMIPPDPAMGDPMALGLGASTGAIGSPYPSTDPGVLAQIVQEALAQAAMQDTQMLEMQQQQAAMQAQPLIDQMLMQAAQPEQMMPPGDPMMAFGEGAIPPMPPEGLM